MVILGWGFAAPGLLWGMGLASAPILIHLFFRRRHREIDWAAMQWLLEAIKKRYRRVRIEQWLILALRTLLIAAVVAAMARPTLEGARTLLAAANRSRHHLIVFDNSLSMHYRLPGGSRWDRAKRLAADILENGQPGDAASVVVLGSPASVLVGDPSPYLADVVKEIEGLRPQHAPARIEPAAELALRLLDNSTFSRKHVYLLTDMQKSTWTGDSPDGDAAPFAAQLRKLSERAEVTVLDVGGVESPNLAVVALEQVEPVAVAGRPAVLRARLANFSSQPREDLPVELIVDGQVEATARASLAAGEQATIHFHHVFREGGERAVETRIPEDSLPEDDRRRLVVNVRQSIAVLAVDGEPSGEPFQSELDYLKVALAPESRQGVPSLLRVDAKQESDLLEARLDDYDLVVLANVGQFTASEVEVLEAYLRRGGAVLFFLGDQVRVDAYNQLLFAEGRGLLPARLFGVQGKSGKTDDFFTFDPLDYRHPIVEPFKNAERAGLLTAKVFQYLRIEPSKDRDAVVALAYSGGDPAIVEGRRGQGAVAIVTTSADLDWNAWALSPSYVPVLQELVRQLVQGRTRRSPVLTTEPIVVPAPREGVDLEATVAPPPPDADQPAKIEESNGSRWIRYSETERAGFYTIRLGSPINEHRPVAVNPWPVESDLARLYADDLRASYPGFEFEIADRWEGRTQSAAATSAAGGELAGPLLYLALFVVFAETILAWRFGHHA